MATQINRAPVVIGSKYTGQRNVSHNLHTGAYSESLPKIEGHALALQIALLQQRK